MLGVLPTSAALVEAVPGGAGVVMFGRVAATGARILMAVNVSTDRFNVSIVAISVGFGTITLVSPASFREFPKGLHPLLDSGILLAAVVSVLPEHV